MSATCIRLARRPLERQLGHRRRISSSGPRRPLGRGSCTHSATLFVLRLILGIGESVAYPSYSKIIALHFPEEHRGLANSVISAGLVLGPGFGMLMGGMLMARFGWRPFFIVLGLVSLLWLIPWIKWMPEARGSIHLDTTGAPSLAEFLRLRSAWGTCVGLFCANYVNYFLITWLPFYLVRERHFSMDKMAKIGGTAYLLGACFATLSGWLSDRWIMSGETPTRVRKTFTGGGLALAGTFPRAICRQRASPLRSHARCWV